MAAGAEVLQVRGQLLPLPAQGLGLGGASAHEIDRDGECDLASDHAGKVSVVRAKHVPGAQDKGERARARRVHLGDARLQGLKATLHVAGHKELDHGGVARRRAERELTLRCSRLQSCYRG